MIGITIKNLTSRLDVLKYAYHALQLLNLRSKEIPSRGEMKYIERLINELQELGYRYDLHCLERDRARDERNGHPPYTLSQRKKAYKRMAEKWQRKWGIPTA